MGKSLNKIMEWTVVVLLSIMLLSVLWGVLTRYIFADQSSWTDELARFALIWVSILGAAYISGKNAHITIDLISKKISERKRRQLEIVTSFIIALFVLVIFIIGGMRYIYISLKLGQTSAALEIPMGYVYLVLPISGVFILFFKIREIRKSYQVLKSTD